VKPKGLEPIPMTKPINSGLILTIALPLFAIGASLGIAVIAFTRGDPTLPDEYHWEGMSLDRDFADARRASDLDVKATLTVLRAEQTCRVSLQLIGTRPSQLRLTLVHGARPELDRQVGLDAVGDAYEGHCGVIPPGQWHLELSDSSRNWSIRQDVSGGLDATRMVARLGPSPPGH